MSGVLPNFLVPRNVSDSIRLRGFFKEVVVSFPFFECAVFARIFEQHNTEKVAERLT